MTLDELIKMQASWYKAMEFNLKIGLKVPAYYCRARAEALEYVIRKKIVY